MACLQFEAKTRKNIVGPNEIRLFAHKPSMPMLAFITAATLAVSRRGVLSSASRRYALASKKQCFATATKSVAVKVERRASIDLGSGATKLMVADVDVSSGRIVRTIFGEERSVKYSLATKETRDGMLPAKITDVGLQVLHDFRRIADELLVQSAKEDRACGVECNQPAAPRPIAAIATEVFRKAPNGPEFLARVRAETGIDVHPISQDVEAELGFRTALAFSRFV